MDSEFSDIWNYIDEFKKNENTIDYEDNIYICKCGGHKITELHCIPVCTSCGITNNHYIDDTAEWTSGLNEDGVSSDPARCGPAQDLDLYSNKWGVGTIMQVNGNSQFKRMAKINFHMTMNHRDRALFHAYKGMDESMLIVLKLPDNIAREAKIMYRKFNQDKLTRGAIRTGVKANCVLYACKNNNFPRTTKEIADAFNIPTRDISRTSHLFRQQNEIVSNSITKPVNVIYRMLNSINCEQRARIKCERLSVHLEECVDLMGKTPSSVAAVVIMTILRLSKNECNNICNVSVPTLTKIENIIKKYLEINPLK